MRVIAGSLKGRKLIFKGGDFRPLTDRVKEAVFNKLQPYFPGSSFLDLYAGTGSIGIEAFSRGASKVIMVESKNIHTEIIRENCKKCGISPVILTQSVLNYIEKYDIREDIVFLDPPFAINAFERTLTSLRNNVLSFQSSSLIIYHHERSLPVTNLLSSVSAVIEDQRNYGSNSITYFRFAK